MQAIGRRSDVPSRLVILLCKIINLVARQGAQGLHSGEGVMKGRGAQRLIRRFLPWLCFAVLMLPGGAPGMDFKIYYQPQLKLKMVMGEGRIQDGDAEKFLAFAKKADRDIDGLVILVLNSPGGNVEAAFRLVDAMDKVRVYATVPDNARCASACASIVFASGERRSIVGSGLLGFHSC